jgi:hypothetical protein
MDVPFPASTQTRFVKLWLSFSWESLNFSLRGLGHERGMLLRLAEKAHPVVPGKSKSRASGSNPKLGWVRVFREVLIRLPACRSLSLRRRGPRRAVGTPLRGLSRPTIFQ